MRKTYLTLILTGLLLTIFSCTYEEGPAISLRTKSSRLSGDWVAEKIIEKYVTLPESEYKDYGYEFRKNGTYTKILNNVREDGTWEFSEDKLQVLLTVNNSPTAEVWTIKRLKNSDMWWWRNIVGGLREEHFKTKK